MSSGPQLTVAERILVRALASQSEMLTDSTQSSRDGVDGAFDPAREARLVFSSEQLHQGLASESLVGSLLQNDGVDPLSLPLSDEDRRILADILMHDQDELTSDWIENAIQALRQKKHLRSREHELKSRIAEAERRQDFAEMARLMQEKLKLDRGLANQ